MNLMHIATWKLDIMAIQVNILSIKMPKKEFYKEKQRLFEWTFNYHELNINKVLEIL